MFQGYYTRWSPCPTLDGKRISCEALTDNRQGFEIRLRPEAGPDLSVAFPSVLLYVNSAEGTRLSRVANGEPLSFPHAFWRVTDSALIAEFHRQSLGTRQDWNITHYAFLTINDCIDVLATEMPVIRACSDD